MIGLNYILNNLFLLHNHSKQKKFTHTATDIRKVQESNLLNIIRRNSDTEFGRKYGFESIQDVSDFQQKVPLSDYNSYTPFIAEIMEGKARILTSDRVSHLVPTSGSSAPVKYIPFTDGLRKEFNRGINVWLYDLYSSYPGLISGKQFWIVTPLSKEENNASSVPIGFAPDSSYLGKLESLLVKNMMVLPDELSVLENEDNYFYILCYYLLANRDIRLFSVWNPSFLISIIQFIEQHFSELVHDIRMGTIRLPRPDIKVDLTISEKLKKYRSPKRANELLSVSQAPRFTINTFWPELSLISCWTEGWADHFLPFIRKKFPGIPIQGKGLLATEGIVSIPINNAKDPLLAYNTHFFEFLHPGNGKICLADELTAGEKYEVILTTSGGLYRYRLCDIVEVTGHMNGIPMLSFIGKSDKTSDLTGEKLSEAHVSEVINDLRKEFARPEERMFLGTARNRDSVGYVLFVEDRTGNGPEISNQLINTLDNRLCENFHYRNSRKMHQLTRPGLCYLTEDRFEKYHQRKIQENHRSTVKYSTLETDMSVLEDLDTEITWM